MRGFARYIIGHLDGCQRGEQSAVHYGNLRRSLWLLLEPKARAKRGLSWLNICLLILIVMATLIAIVETEPLIVRGRQHIFSGLQYVFGTVFAVEYAARLWVAAENPGDEGVWAKRWRFVRSPSAIIDLVVVLAAFAPLVAGDVASLRMLRLIRILGLARLGKLSAAVHGISAAVYSRRFELGVTAGIAIMFMVFGATLLYWIEGEVQPDQFGSIPRAMWWAVITMTTIGYGDAYPITAAGRFAAAFIALSGVGLIAMPTGILAAAFSDAMQSHHHGPHGEDVDLD